MSCPQWFFRLCLFAFLLCATPLWQARRVQSSAAKNPKQWALLIGINDYPGEIQDLRYARDDARALRELLVTAAGYLDDHVQLLTDDGAGAARATRQNILGAINQTLAARVQPNDQVLVFLAGHGIVRGAGTEAKSYFLPADVAIQSPQAVEQSSLEMEELARQLSTLKAAQFTVFVDACREDPFPGRGLKENALTDVMTRGLRITRLNVGTTPAAAQPEAPTSVIFYACRIGERAYENPKLQHGIFTHFILRGLRELAARPDGRVEAGQLAGYLRDNVRKWRAELGQTSGLFGEQTPTMIASEVRGPVLVAYVTPPTGTSASAATTSGVTLSTLPEGALLSLNGQPVGSGPIFQELVPREYTVRAELPGFQPTETKINLLAGYQQEVTLNLRPLATSASYERGVAFEEQQLWPQAIAAYEQALRESTPTLAVYERLANVYAQNGRWREAVATLTTALQGFPDSAVLYARRSRAYSDWAESATAPAMGAATTSGFGAGFAPAATSTEGSTGKTKKPKEEKGGNSKGKASEEKAGKKAKRAQADEDAAPAANDDDAQAEEKKNSKKKGSKKNSKQADEKPRPDKSSSDKSSTDKSFVDEGARSLGNVFPDAAPTSATANNAATARNLTPQAEGTNLTEAALRDAEVAVQKDGRLVAAHLALGFAYLLNGRDPNKALAAFVQASTLAPEEPEAYFGVGAAYRLLRQEQQALPQLKKAVALRPDYSAAQRELAYCYHARGETDLAIQQYQVASSRRRKMKHAGELASNDLALAALYQRKGETVGGAQGEEYKKAARAYEKDARDHEPELKVAAKKLAGAGVAKIVEEKLSFDVRNLFGRAKAENDKTTNPPSGGNSGGITLPGKGGVKVTVPLPGKVSDKIKDALPIKPTVPIKLPGKLGGKTSESDKNAGRIPIKLPEKILTPGKGKSADNEPAKSSGAGGKIKVPLKIIPRREAAKPTEKPKTAPPEEKKSGMPLRIPLPLKKLL